MRSVNRVFFVFLFLFLGSLTSYGQFQFWSESNACLDSVWRRIKTVDLSEKGITILHLGDSHMSGGYFTKPIEQKLVAQYGDKIHFDRIGVPGATFLTFTKEKYMERIKAYSPDLIIISLGTNDSYTYRFSESKMQENIEDFFGLLRDYVMDVPIVLTTPPLSYLRHSVRRSRKKGRRRYRTTYEFNNNTSKASLLIRTYAKEHGMACYDLTSAMGGKAEAEQWLRRGLMNPDHVHYTVAGYTRHGEMVAEALLRSIAGFPFIEHFDLKF